jgi:hypothetical protein
MTHVNSAEQSITISLRGTSIGRTLDEFMNYPEQEGVFFGNVFADTPTKFVCNGNYDDQVFGSNGRNCTAANGNCGFDVVGSVALETFTCPCQQYSDLWPIRLLGQTTWIDEPYYDACQAGGDVYHGVVTNYLKAYCGDGICAPGEDCPADCGIVEVYGVPSQQLQP